MELHKGVGVWEAGDEEVGPVGRFEFVLDLLGRRYEFVDGIRKGRRGRMQPGFLQSNL